MKITLLIMSLAPGGAEILCRGLAREFVRLGHSCQIVAVCDAATVGNSPKFEAAFEQELRADGIVFDKLANAARRNPLVGARRLRQVLKAFGPDVLHIHTAHGLVFQAAGLLRLPTIYTQHNVRLNFPAAYFRVFDRFVDRYVAICAPCRELLERTVRKPIVPIPNGVPDGFGGGGRDGRLARDPLILSVGTATDQKDYPTLARAAAICAPQFAAQGREVRFQVAGGGNLELLRDALAREGLSDAIELLGTRADISSLMSTADLLVNSSVFEGLPITLIEAAMSGLPAVATDVGGNSELVADGVSGFLVPPRCPELLAERIVEALSDDERYARLCAGAHAVSRRFTLTACARSHIELYQELLETGRDRQALAGAD